LLIQMRSSNCWKTIKTVIELMDDKLVYISEMTEMEMLCNPNVTKESRQIIQAMLHDCYTTNRVKTVISQITMEAQRTWSCTEISL
jgi:hypothetical protein